jgi:hypothetical protein
MLVRHSLTALALMLALCSAAVAAPKEGEGKKKEANGTNGEFSSATIADGKLSLTIKTEGGDKTFTMGAEVTVHYTEKDGKKLARGIMAGEPKPGKEREGKGENAKGALTKLEASRKHVVATIGGAEYLMGNKLRVIHAEGSTEAKAIVGGGDRKSKDGDKPAA